MTAMAMKRALRNVKGAARVSLLLGACLVAVLTGAAAALPGPLEVGAAAVELAGSLPADVTRLALTATIVLALINLVLIGAIIGLVQRAASKPCLLFRDDGLAILGSAVDKAVRRQSDR